MQRKEKKIKAKSLLVLAVLCVLATELLFCRVADPELFDDITQPVITATKKLWVHTRQTVHHLALALAAPPPEAELEEPQVPAETGLGGQRLLQDPSITELTQRGESEVLTGGNVDMVFYSQRDEVWADQAYGRDNIGDYGCGPTAMAMVVSSMTEQAVNPEEMATWAVKNGHWASKGGSYLSIVPSSAKSFGLNCVSVKGRDAEQLRQKLAGGGVMVALVTRGHFTQSGHFILLRGVTLTGEILVADPNSRDNSLTLWDAQLILDELSASTSNGAPLWYITS